MIQEFLFDRVLAEPSDSAQPPDDSRAGPAPGFQLPGEALDVSAADSEQGQGAGTAPGGELAQVQGIRLPGEAAVSCGVSNSATGSDLGFYAERSYSLTRPPTVGRRLIRSWERSAMG